MGLYNRPYLRSDQGGSEGGRAWSGGNIRIGLPRPTPAVITIIAVCTFIFLLTLFTGRENSRIFRLLSLSPALPQLAFLWNYVTFQFVHAGPGHFLFNMMGLYFFGPHLEGYWGSKRFATFYVACGAFAGVCYVAFNWALSPMFGPPSALASLVGASGGILAILAACAILFPEIVVLIFPIRWVAVFFAALYVLNVAWSYDLSDVAHLGGMVAAVLWVWLVPRLRERRMEHSLAKPGNTGAWKKRMEKLAAEQAEVDRILQKIHNEGLNSLSTREKKILRDTTRKQQSHEAGFKK